MSFPTRRPEAPAAASAEAALIGGAARRALSEGARGRVIAAFRRSFYVQTESGLACIGPHGLGAGPLNVALAGREDSPFATAMPREETGVRVAGGRLHVEALNIRLDGAARWAPAPVAWTAAANGAARGRLGAAVTDRLPAEGLAPLVFAGREDDAVARRAAPAVAALRAWLGSGGDTPPEACMPLIGLGPGLTPSGDDLIGGLLVCLRSRDRHGIAERLATWALALAPARTNAISGAHLAAAAAGEGAAALHDALAATAAQDDAALTRAVDGLAAIGHVSGWDALAGAAMGFGA